MFPLRLISACRNHKTSRLVKCVTSKVKPNWVHSQVPIVHHQPYSIKATNLDTSRELVQVEFNDGNRYEFPWLFLQDNCSCSECFHPSSQSRLRKLIDLDLNNAISSVSIHSDSAIHCKWEDGHEAIFTEKWLKDRRFTQDNIQVRKTVLRDNPELVGGDVTFPRDSFHHVMTDENRLLGCLETLSKKGLYLLEGASQEVGQLKKLTDRIGFIRLTHYGYEFTVKSEPNAVNLAYTSARLGVHTDLPYYVYPPGVQLLHCIKQYPGEDGGQSHLVDGFNVALQLKQNYPNYFKILCETPVEFCDIGTDYTSFYKVHHSPTFVCHPEKDNLIRIVYSNQQASSHQAIKVDQVKPLYEALKIFTELCYKPENLIEFKLKEGEVLIFDNWRMLHGREGFDPSKGHRHLEGCYLDWDEIYSRIRVLKNVLQADADVSKSPKSKSVAINQAI